MSWREVIGSSVKLRRSIAIPLKYSTSGSITDKEEFSREIFNNKKICKVKFTVLASVELDSHGDAVVPSGRVDADELSDDGRVELVAQHRVTVLVTFEHLQVHNSLVKNNKRDHHNSNRQPHKHANSKSNQASGQTYKMRNSIRNKIIMQIKKRSLQTNKQNLNYKIANETMHEAVQK